MAVSGASVVSAAVTAAVLARAPRRTVAAVAAAVASALVQKAYKLPDTTEMLVGVCCCDSGALDADALVSSLRAVRPATRRRKRSGRRELN